MSAGDVHCTNKEKIKNFYVFQINKSCQIIKIWQDCLFNSRGSNGSKGKTSLASICFFAFFCLTCLGNPANINVELKMNGGSLMCRY